MIVNLVLSGPVEIGRVGPDRIKYSGRVREEGRIEHHRNYNGSGETCKQMGQFNGFANSLESILSVIGHKNKQSRE